MLTGKCAIASGQCYEVVYVLSCQCLQRTVSMLGGAVQKMSQKIDVCFCLFIFRGRVGVPANGEAVKQLRWGKTLGLDERYGQGHKDHVLLLQYAICHRRYMYN